MVEGQLTQGEPSGFARVIDGQAGSTGTLGIGFFDLNYFDIISGISKNIPAAKYSTYIEVKDRNFSGKKLFMGLDSDN